MGIGQHIEGMAAEEPVEPKKGLTTDLESALTEALAGFHFYPNRALNVRSAVTTFLFNQFKNETQVGGAETHALLQTAIDSLTSKLPPDLINTGLYYAQYLRAYPAVAGREALGDGLSVTVAGIKKTDSGDVLLTSQGSWKFPPGSYTPEQIPRPIVVSEKVLWK